MEATSNLSTIEADVIRIWDPVSRTHKTVTELIAEGGADVSGKADVTYVDDELATRDSAIALKAATTYVDSELGTRDAAIALKAATTYVDAQVATREPNFVCISPVIKNLDIPSGDIQIKLNSNATTAELDHLIGCTSALQGQIDAKQQVLTSPGIGTDLVYDGYKLKTIDSSTYIDVGTVVQGDSSENVTIELSTAFLNTVTNKQDKVAGVNDTEIGYLDGVTSAIQTQIDTLSSSKASLTGSNFSGMVSITGTDVQAPLTTTAGGVYIGSYASTGDYKIELCAANSGDLTYVDFTIPNSDYKGRILYNNVAGEMHMTANNVQALTLSSDVTVYNNLKSDAIKPKTNNGNVIIQNTAGTDIAKFWDNTSVELKGDTVCYGALTALGNSTVSGTLITDTIIKNIATEIVIGGDVAIGNRLLVDTIDSSIASQITMQDDVIIQGNLTVNGTVNHPSIFWGCVTIDTDGTVLSSSGSETISVNHSATGVYDISWTTAHPRGGDYIISISSNNYHVFMNTTTPTSTGFPIASRSSANTAVDARIYLVIYI